MRVSLFAFVSFSIALSSVHGAGEDQPPPPTPSLTEAENNSPDPNLYMTDFAAIEAVASNVDQTSSVDPLSPPNQEPASTEVTAVEGEITEAGFGTESKRDDSLVYKRSPDLEARFNKGNIANIKAEARGVNDYIKVFEASTSTRDASIQGTAYLTYKLVSNSTYNVNDCLAFCDSVPECRFANLYYEFNNPLYDWVFSEKSNLACALYGDVHTAAEKTNFAGQQLKPLPEPLTSITRSTGWAKEAPFNPTTPAGYELSFGPISKAVSQSWSMGFSALSTYDVDLCASLCNNKTPDPVLGACQSFNIWRVLVDRLPTTYICQLYSDKVISSYASYSGVGNQEVTMSRGYNRVNIIPNSRIMTPTDWTTSGNANQGFLYYGHSNTQGHYNGRINFSTPPATGFLSNRNGFSTTPGRRYTLQLWHTRDAIRTDLSIRWNGALIYGVQSNLPLDAIWKPLTFTVTAQGSDRMEVFGGGYGGYLYTSDYALFLAS